MVKKLSGVLVAALFVFTSTAHAEEEKKPQAGYAGGFFVQSDDGSFNLKIKGRLHPRFAYDNSSTTDASMGFLLRRATLSFIAQVKENTTFTLGLSHATNSKNFSTINVAAAALDQSIIPQFNVSVGMTGLPLDLLGDSSSGASLLPEFPIVYTQSDGSSSFATTREAFGSPDGLGIWLTGDISKFSYQWGVVNGAESNYNVNLDTKFSTGARLSFNILDPVNLGSLTDYDQSEKPALTVSLGSIYQGRRADAGFVEALDSADPAGAPHVAPEVRRLLQFSSGAAFRWKGLSLQGEVYNRYTKFTAFGDLPVELREATLTDFGYYGMAGYYVIPKKLELALMASQIFREGPDNNGNQFAGGVNYYIHGQNLKMQLCYVWTEDYDDILGTKNNKIQKAVLQMQTQF